MTKRLIKDDFGEIWGYREVTEILATEIKAGDNIIARGIDNIIVLRTKKSKSKKSIYVYFEDKIVNRGIETFLQLKTTSHVFRIDKTVS